MTAREAAEKIRDLVHEYISRNRHHDLDIADFKPFIEAAVAAERERCAQVVERFVPERDETEDDCEDFEEDDYERIAQAIRSGT